MFDVGYSVLDVFGQVRQRLQSNGPSCQAVVSDMNSVDLGLVLATAMPIPAVPRRVALNQELGK